MEGISGSISSGLCSGITGTVRHKNYRYLYPTINNGSVPGMERECIGFGVGVATFVRMGGLTV